jgi:hypothetical protein
MSSRSSPQTHIHTHSFSSTAAFRRDSTYVGVFVSIVTVFNVTRIAHDCVNVVYIGISFYVCSSQA